MSASLPTSVPALISILQGALPTGFQVTLGRVSPVYVAAQSVLLTGVRFAKDDFAVLGPTYRHEEQYTISCSLITSAGNSDPAARLQEAYTLYADISIAVANNPTLNNTVRVAWTKQSAFSPTKDVRGMDVGQLDFLVECQVRVNSLT